MDCDKFNGYLDNFENLTDEELSTMKAHASNCERCAKELEFMNSILETVKSLPAIEAPTDFIERLNARIDEEERHKTVTRRAVYAVRRNWKQYTAAAACLALVAVITANGKLLTDRFNNSDDGVIINDTPVTDNAEPTLPPEVIAEAVAPVASDSPVSAVAANTAAQSEHKASNSARQAREVQTATAAPKESKPAVSDNQTLTTDSAETAKTGIQPMSMDAEPDMQIAAYSLEPGSMSRMGGGTGIIEGYTVSGKPVMELASYEGDESSEQQAIGRLKISPKDETDAMEVIMKYSFEVDGDYYTTSPDNMVNIFCDLVDRGVDYANYTPDFEGEIKFQLVIG